MQSTKVSTTVLQAAGVVVDALKRVSEGLAVTGTIETPIVCPLGAVSVVLGGPVDREDPTTVDLFVVPGTVVGAAGGDPPEIEFSTAVICPPISEVAVLMTVGMDSVVIDRAVGMDSVVIEGAVGMDSVVIEGAVGMDSVGREGVVGMDSVGIEAPCAVVCPFIVGILVLG